jgi:NADPH:quinone reductase-like Zn-dependent oxidoreductase
MRAVAVRAFRGAPELVDVPPREAAEDEIRVRLQAAGVNPFDWKILDGIFDGRRPHVFPLIAGVDGAGEVESVGAQVRRFHVGDRVFGSFLHDPIGVGTYAELAPVPERNAIASLPAPVTFVEAAALPTAGMTALEAVDRLALRSGETLVIVGASGGVGSIATGLAAQRGIRVIASARPDSEKLVRALGATERRRSPQRTSPTPGPPRRTE